MSVYFIKDAPGGLVKIGHSADPWSRMSGLQTGSTNRLEMLAIIDGGVEVERGLHNRFAGLRARGEWFGLFGDLQAYIADLPPAQRPVAVRASRTFWNGLTDGEVAKATGLSPSNLNRIRRGEINPTAENAILIQRATGVSAVRLLFRDLADEALAHVPHLGSKAA